MSAYGQGPLEREAQEFCLTRGFSSGGQLGLKLALDNATGCINHHGKEEFGIVVFIIPNGECFQQ